MIEREVDRILRSYIAPGMTPDEYIYDDLVTMVKEIHSTIPQLSQLDVHDIQGMKFDAVYEKVKELAVDAYKTHEASLINFYNSVLEKYDPNFVPQEPFSENNMVRGLERDILLKTIDAKWIDLHNIDMVRESIGLRAYGQKDPLIEYKKEAYNLFNKMMYEIQGETVKYLFRMKFGIQIMNNPVENMEE